MAIDSPIPTWVKRWLGICTFVLIYDGCFCTLRPHTFPDGCLSVFFIGRKCFSNMHARIQRWDRGSGPPPPLENHKNIGFLSNTGPNPLKIIKLPSQIQRWTIIGPRAKHHLMAFRWRAVGGPHIVVFGSSLPSSTIKTNKKQQLFLSWNPSDKTFWIRV